MANRSMSQTSDQGTRLLKGKNAVIFGATGSVGRGVAKEFAAQGATLFLSGRRPAVLEELTSEIKQQGGAAFVAHVDATDEEAVNSYLNRVTADAGSIDVFFNAMGPEPRTYANGTSTLELSLEQFMLPSTTLLASQFITARATARHMVRQHSGVMLFLTAIPARGLPNTAAIGAAFGAIESLLRCLAAELGPSGIRVAGIRSGGMVDSRIIREAVERTEKQLAIPRDQAEAMLLAQPTLLRRPSTVADTARLAAFLASEQAQGISGGLINSSSGRIVD